MSLTYCGQLAAIALAILITCSSATASADMNNILRDVSTEVNTMPSPTTGSGVVSKTTATTIRQMILRNSSEKKDNSANDFATINGDNVDGMSYNEPSSAELLRFVNDSDNKNTNDDNYNNDFSDVVNVYNDNNNNNNEIASDSFDNGITYNNNNNNINNYQTNVNRNENNDYIESLSVKDQVRLLSKQLNVLMNRRREDYELLERNLRKSLRITQNNRPQNSQTHSTDSDLRNELESLRQDVQALRSGHISDATNNKERLTIEWLQQSIAELRKQLVELQQIASNAMRDVTTRTQSWEDLTTLRSDFQQLKLELAALKERQQQNDVYVQELREETEQQEEEFQHFIIQTQQMCVRNKQTSPDNQLQNMPTTKQQVVDTSFGTNTRHLSASESLEEETDNKEIKETSSLTQLADHKRRHCRFQRQQLHELQLSQRQLKRQFNELKYHRIAERVRSIEIEQHRIADANFNLSRQIASLDKLHSSMLELLEDVENVQTKVDKNLPDLRHEISKLEFANAQLMSEQNLVREEGKNVARSLQAMAVSVSTLQDERDGVRRMQSGVTEMRTKLDRLQTMVEDIQRALQHRQHRGYGNKDNKHLLHHHNNSSSSTQQQQQQQQQSSTTGTPMQNAEFLVAKLENVEAQFESIIEKLPKDCSEVTPAATKETGGLYLITPSAERHPLMAHCTADGWTTVQKRYDGSADFNRSWEDYANGFGSPAGEFWMGNEQLHHLTLNNCTRLRVVMQDIYDNVWLADYTQFYISSRSDGYRLHIGGYSGNASDALDYQQGMQFSAIDVDRDISRTHCAANYEGGWWFSHCQHANLNGRYNLGLTWFDAARNEWIAVKSSHMMVKRQSPSTCKYIQESLAKSQQQQNAAVSSVTATTVTPMTTTTTTTLSTPTTTATINSSKSIPLNNLRIQGHTQSSFSSTTL